MMKPDVEKPIEHHSTLCRNRVVEKENVELETVTKLKHLFGVSSSR